MVQVRRGVASVSLNARDRGGTIAGNFLQALLHHSTTPSHLLRSALQDPNSTSYSAVIDKLTGYMTYLLPYHPQFLMGVILFMS